MWIVKELTINKTQLFCIYAFSFLFQYFVHCHSGTQHAQYHDMIFCFKEVYPLHRNVLNSNDLVFEKVFQSGKNCS